MMDILFLTGRFIFGGYFIYSGINHFRNLESMAQYTKGVGGVPAPKVAVAGTGLLLLLGGLSVLLGLYPTIGLILLLVFLVPTTLIMHRFWDVRDPMQRMGQQVNFTKNVALIGATLMMFWPQNWPLSLGGW